MKKEKKGERKRRKDTKNKKVRMRKKRREGKGEADERREAEARKEETRKGQPRAGGWPRDKRGCTNKQEALQDPAAGPRHSARPRPVRGDPAISSVSLPALFIPKRSLPGFATPNSRSAGALVLNTPILPPAGTGAASSLRQRPSRGASFAPAVSSTLVDPSPKASHSLLPHLALTHPTARESRPKLH